ncbi:histone-like protein [Salmonella phage selz]|nr:histone family DNA-binding [Salmonella phage ST-W77]YP_009881316.1 histone family DNA-binding [Salmonella phage SenALZ1]YP_009966687.1 histone family DNA-binding [Salmonella phage Se-G]UJQ69976.1 histone-like protein [Salmonella phage selz]UQS92998.1 hypothetical protein BRM13313_00068 [Salmonella phage BRM 13313]ARB12292.1 putative histone-like protein [Salmonella phage ST-W77]AXY86690.1 hypothetical protein SeLz1_95 [Salmonella phage SenALZ1]UJQ70151.1 histone-like protein [Salmonella p
MKSMIKRKVDISLNAHIEMVQQVVLDAYEIQKDRRIRHDLDPTDRGNMLYYRMLRQTGHTAVLKKLLSEKFQNENGVNIFGVFHTARERDTFFTQPRNITTGEWYEKFDRKEKTATITQFMGSKIDKADIIVFSDTLHDAKRLSVAHKMLQDNRICFTNLTLVVFLG